MRKTKKIGGLILAIILTGLMISFWLYDNYRTRRKEILLTEQETVQSQYSSVINSYRLVSQTLYDEVVNKPEIAAILKTAKTLTPAKQVPVRRDLYNKIKPVFDRMQNRNFKQFNLYLSDSTNFLNMYKPEDFGGNVGVERQSIAKAIESKAYTEGFEEGKIFNGYRYIFPIFDEAKNFVGLVEMSVSFGTLQAEINDLFPYTTEFILKKNVVGDIVFGDDVRNFALSTLNKNFFAEAEPENKKRVEVISTETKDKLNRSLKNSVEEAMNAGELISDDLSVDSLNYLVTMVPINNINGTHVAYLISYRLTDSIYFLKNDFYIRLTFTFALILVILFLTFYIYDGQKKLLEIGEKLQVITTSMTEGIMFINKHKEITFFNPAIKLMIGLSSQELANQKITKLIRLTSEDSQTNKNFIITKALKTGRRIFENDDIFLVKKDGSRIAVAITATPLIAGSESGCLLVFRDITIERDVDKAKTEFVSLASHQLKTPLSAINWYTEMLTDEDVGPLNSRQKDFVKEIIDGNQRMIKLINSLLNVSRIDMGTFSIVPEKVDLIALIESVVEEQKFSLEAKRQLLNKRYDKALPKINLDPNLMRIVVQNLLSNAIKYTREEGQIEIQVKKQGSDVYMKVADNGYGIPKAEQAHIFTKLFRADNVKSKKVEGTGLGLYVAKAVIEAFGGKIWFESVEEKGTTFYLTLPLSGVEKKDGTKGLEANT